MYIACLALFTVAQIGLALTPTSAFWLLLVLRCVSASGSAPIIALSTTHCSIKSSSPNADFNLISGAGTVGDFATPDERGIYMGFITAGPMIGPCIGYDFALYSESMTLIFHPITIMLDAQLLL